MVDGRILAGPSPGVLGDRGRRLKGNAMTNIGLKHGRLLTDIWYGDELETPCDRLDDKLDQYIANKRLKTFVLNSKLLHGLALFLIGREYDLILTKINRRSGFALPVLLALTGSRKLVLLEFIFGEKQPPFFLRPFAALSNWLFGACVRGAMIKGQVLTPQEKDNYSKLFAIPPDRLDYIPWPLNNGLITPRVDRTADEAQFVMASGRADCDWETIFAAAKGARWPLVVVCSRSDLERVNALNPDGRAKILSEIPLEEHGRLVGETSVYALCLREGYRSAGQIRLGNCNEAGTPVVATRVMGLESYIVENVNALSVPAGDSNALRTAIDSLMNSPEARVRLAKSALQHSLLSTRKDYMEKIDHLIAECFAEVQSGGG